MPMKRYLVLALVFFVGATWGQNHERVRQKTEEIHMTVTYEESPAVTSRRLQRRLWDRRLCRMASRRWNLPRQSDRKEATGNQSRTA